MSGNGDPAPRRRRLAVIAALAAAWCGSMAALTLTIPLYREFPRIPLDFAWEVALVDLFDRGELSGRDFIFTYGPLTQLAYAASGLLRRASALDRSGLSYATLIGAALLLLAASVWMTPRLRPSASAAAFLLFALFLNFQFDRWNLFLRAYATLAATLLLVVALTHRTARDRLIWSAATGLGCVAAQLVSFDAGVFSITGCIGTLGLAAVLGRLGLTPGSGLTWRGASAMVAAVAVTAAAANLLLAALFWLTARQPVGLTDYHYYNWRLASAYNVAFGAQWDLNPVLAALLLCALAFVLASTVAGWRRWTWEQQAFAISLGVLAAVSFKGAVVRSGEPKILISCLPLLYMTVVLAMADQPVRWFRSAGLILIVALAVVWPSQGALALHRLVEAIADPAHLRTRWSPLFTHHVAAGAVIPEGVSRELATGTRLLAFPYHNLLPLAAGRAQVAPSLQPYAAIDLESQRHFVAQASRVRHDTEVIYAIDGPAAGEIDLVPNVTRSPLIFEYLQGQFAPKTGVLHPPGYVVLSPRARTVTLPGSAVPFTARRDGDATVVALARPAACSLLKITPRVRYPFTAAFGRPTPLAVSVSHRGGVVQRQRLVTLDAARPFATYVPLVTGDAFVRVLEWPDVRGAGLGSVVLDSIRLEPVALGRFDVRPSAIEMRQVECVNLGDHTLVPVQLGSDTPIGPVLAGQPVRQEFVATEEGLAGVSLRTATYARANSGTVTFSVVAIEEDGRDEVVHAVTLDAAAIRDNEWLTLWFAPQTRAGRRFAVVVSASQAAPDKAITLWYQSGNPYADGDLTIGAVRVDGDLALQLHFKR